MAEPSKVTVERQQLKNIGGSWYIPVSAHLRRSANISETDVAAFERAVLEGGELGEVTIRIEKSSEPNQEPPKTANQRPL